MSKLAYIVVVVSIAIYYFKFYKKEVLPPVYEGKYLPEFRQVAEVFRKQVESGQERGGNFAAYYKGRLAVDLWGGYADIESKQKWRNDTLPITFSTTKGIISILAAKMVDQKLLDYNKLVSDYWPGFGCNGKENITVEMLLSHVAGLAYLDNPISLVELHHNPSKVEKSLEKETPKWPPGSAHGYHSLTFGMYVDRLLSKADPKKRRIDQLFHDEIAKPFDIEFFIGLPLTKAYRAARFNPADLFDFLMLSLTVPSMWKFSWKIMTDPDNLMKKASTATIEKITSDPYNREVAISSANGHGTARGMAKLYGILANGGKIDGKQLMSKETLKLFSAPKNIGWDLNFDKEKVMGRGVFFHTNPKGEQGFGHPGYGGQMAYADPKNNVGMAYVTNDLSAYSFGNDPKYLALQKAFYDCVDRIEKSKSELSSKFETLSM